VPGAHREQYEPEAQAPNTCPQHRCWAHTQLLSSLVGQVQPATLLGDGVRHLRRSRQQARMQQLGWLCKGKPCLCFALHSMYIMYSITSCTTRRPDNASGPKCMSIEAGCEVSADRHELLDIVGLASSQWLLVHGRGNLQPASL
jgi:hypothetical protein